VFGIVVRHGSPFELRPEVLLDSRHYGADEALQVHPVTELGRDDEFPKELISCRLPFLQAIGHIDSEPLMIESDCFGIPFMCGTLPCQIAAMRPPLPRVACIG
jgi:hypothetical protein